MLLFMTLKLYRLIRGVCPQRSEHAHRTDYGDTKMPPLQQTAFSYDELISCAKGELFGPGNPQLPMPPMLMCDRITEIRVTADRTARDILFLNST